jgi:hypothetical protein
MAQKHRSILTEKQAIEIFGLQSAKSSPLVVSSALVAKRYGINERTVRDVWKQRTWTHVTSSVPKKRMGRPFGSKDSRPRKKKIVAGIPVYVDGIDSCPLVPSARPHVSATRPASKIDQGIRASSTLTQSLRMQLVDTSSIDDQLLAWANYAPRWITDAALN